MMKVSIAFLLVIPLVEAFAPSRHGLTATFDQMHRTRAVFCGRLNMLILSESDVRRCLRNNMNDVIEANRQAFVAICSTNPTGIVPTRLGLTYSERSPSTKNDEAQDWTLFKPAADYEDGTVVMGMKLVSVRKNNQNRHGLPLVPATVMMMDAETGIPSGIMGGTYLTALRTASGSALATDICAPADSQNLVIFGAGLQAEAHLHSILSVRPHLNAVTIVNRSRGRPESLLEEEAEILKGKTTSIVLLEETDQVNNALSEADIVVACTNTIEPLFSTAQILKPGCHVNGVGSYTPDMAEVPKDFILDRCAQVVIDSPEALSVGDLNGLVQSEQHILLGDALKGGHRCTCPDASGRRNCTFFKSVGTAIQDVFTGALVIKKAQELRIGTEADLLS